ncbi:hypothetical protein ACIQU5_10660 [Streptomyces sp. NPDC090306]|uniref:hypothetical protein n=1 Tax=unclassified Streptomyces TaxID=2593676 RepID=UPI0036E46A1B
MQPTQSPGSPSSPSPGPSIPGGQKTITQSEFDKFFADFKKNLMHDLAKNDMRLEAANMQVASGSAQAVTASGQLLKIDQSLVKWDEKGLTIAGRQIKIPGLKNLAMHDVVNAKFVAEEKAKKEKADQGLKELAASVAEADTKARKAETDADAAKSSADKARRSADTAAKGATGAEAGAKKAEAEAKVAKQQADGARRLLNEANTAAKDAAGSASKANTQFDELQKRLKHLETELGV